MREGRGAKVLERMREGLEGQRKGRCGWMGEVYR